MDAASGNLEQNPEQLDQRLMLEEVRGVVATAAAAGETLRIGSHVKRLKARFEKTGISQTRISDELILAAAHAGIAVEMDRAD